MKKRNLLLISAAFLMLAGTSCTKDESMDNIRLSATDEVVTKVSIREILEVETDTVGQLAEKVGDRKDIVQKLIIHGPINAVDVRLIREMPELLSIDMKEATICGGDSTYTVPNWGTYKLYDNIIGEHMFSDTHLSEIVLPDNIVEIDSYAFYSIDGTSENPFTSIVIPEGVTRICDHAFSGCYNLESINFPSSLREVADNAFSACSKLTSVQIEEGVERFGEEVFGSCSNLQEIALPASLTAIGSNCFGASGLVSIDIPETVTEFGEEIFQSCDQLQTVTLPDNMTEIPNRMFDGCNVLSSVKLPQELKTIGEYVFFENYALTNIELPESLESIQRCAFQGSGLRSLTLPSNVSSLMEYCFERCHSLVSLTILSNQLRSLPRFAFQDCTSLTNITWPESLENLDESSFNGCTSLVSVIFPNSLTNLGPGCFQNCSNLSDVRLPERLQKIERLAFYRCSALDSISIPASVTEIEGSVFAECSSLHYVQLVDGLRTIGNAFNDCTSLEVITIPRTVTSVSTGVFEYCENLTAVFWNASIDVPVLFSSSDNTSSFFRKNPYCLLYLTDGTTVVNDPDIKNIVINGVAEEIVLSSEMGNFHVPQAFKAAKATYTRDFTYPTYPGEAAGWRSISLPFTVTEITGPQGQTLAPFNANVEGAKPFWLRRLTANGFENVTEIEAGVPYIIAMPNNEAYNAEYNISGTVTFTAQSAAGIDFPATDDVIRDVGPDFVLNANYNYRPMGTSVYALNETATDTRPAGSVFVRNERDLMPFEGYVSSALITNGAPAYYSIFGDQPATRTTRPLGPVPSIDDM